MTTLVLCPDRGRKPSLVPEEKLGNSVLCRSREQKNKAQEFNHELAKLGLCWREDRLPVDDRVPEHALVTSIEIAMQRIKIEGNDVAAADRRV
jgi:hypothetical protein